MSTVVPWWTAEKKMKIAGIVPKSFFSKQIGGTDGAGLRLHVLFYLIVWALRVRTPKSGARLTSLVWRSEKGVYISYNFLYRLHIFLFFTVTRQTELGVNFSVLPQL